MQDAGSCHLRPATCFLHPGPSHPTVSAITDQGALFDHAVGPPEVAYVSPSYGSRRLRGSDIHPGSAVCRRAVRTRVAAAGNQSPSQRVLREDAYGIGGRAGANRAARVDRRHRRRERQDALTMPCDSGVRKLLRVPHPWRVLPRVGFVIFIAFGSGTRGPARTASHIFDTLSLQ